MSMDGDSIVSVLNKDKTGLGDVWASFCATDDVALVMNIGPSTTSSTEMGCTAGRLRDLPFASSSNEVQFGWKNGSSLGSPDLGYLMALDWDGHIPASQPPAYTKSWTVGEIMAAFSVPSPKHPLISKILNAIGPFTDGGVIKDELRVMQLATTPKQRNGIWLVPGDKPTVTTRLTYHLVSPDSFSQVASAIASQYQIFQGIGDEINKLVQSISFQVTREVIGIQTSFGFISTTTFNLRIQVAIRGFIFWLEYTKDGVSCTLTEDPSLSDGDPFHSEGLVARLNRLRAGDSLEASNAMPEFENVFKNIDLWNLTVGRTNAGVTYFMITLLVHWETNGQTFLLGLTYDSQGQTFTGQLLFQSSFPNDFQRATPYYDPRTELPAGILKTKPEYLDGVPSDLKLEKLFSDAVSAPDGMPTRLASATISFSQVDKKLFFGAAIVDGSTGQPSFPSPFTWDALKVCAMYSKADGVAFDAVAMFSLHPREKDRDKYPDASLSVGLQYAEGTWTLSASVDELNFGLLGGYFEASLSDAFLEMLGKLTLRELDIFYTFSSTPKGDQPSKSSSFLVRAILLLGDLELDLIYQYANSSMVGNGKTAAQQKVPNNSKPSPASTEDGKTEWSFEAHLRSTDKSATIGDIANSFVEGASHSLPEFVSQISVTPSGTSTDLVSLKALTTGEGSLACSLEIHVGIFDLTLVQISSKEGPTKRMFRLTANKIPLISTLPLIKELPQPFDALVYLWVLDSSEKGWTSSDLEKLKVLNLKTPILTKDVSTGKDPERIFITPGHRFMVVDGGKVAVDHKFGEPDEKMGAEGSDKGTTENQTNGTPSGSGTSTEKSEVPPSKGALAKKTKFLTLSNIGLQYKDGVLWLILDATLSLGPIEIALLGFGLGLPIGKKYESKTDKSIKSFTLNDMLEIVEHVEFQISGLGVSFNRPPLLLAGVFEHEVTALEDAYRGGIAVMFTPYAFLAVGQYSIVHDKDGNSYKSVFVFAKLMGPLITLEFAIISGVRLGFGYNSLVRSPAISEITDFPFISDDAASGSGNNPMEMLKAMTKGVNGKSPWVSVKQDSYWFAVGMTITAFDLLQITAVALLAFKDTGVIASIYADAIAKMPSEVGNDETDKMILFVELGMVAEMNFAEDYFRVEASLAPTSFILVPQCHLYGGFALCYWYGRNPHAGDWVFSVGGYHKSFNPPPWYPVPSRLGVNFSIGGGLSVRAEAYFAVTPKVVMGGAMLHVSLDIGPVSAYLDASFDALINLNPLHYIADMRISVGVTCDIHILFIHIHISVSIGADLHIEGPEFGGVAQYVFLAFPIDPPIDGSSVDFYFFGFDVRFGSHPDAPGPVHLEEFYDIVHRAGPQEAGDGQQNKDEQAENIPETMKHLKFCLEDGAFPMPQDDNPTNPSSGSADKNPPNAGLGSLWHVKGGSFQFRIACDFAISEGQIEESDILHAQVPGKDKLEPIYAKPMWVTKPITSTLIVSIVNQEHGKPVAGFKTSFVVKPVPSALWGSYDPAHDPAHAEDKQVMKDHLLSTADAVRPLAMAVSLHSPDPQLARSPIPDFNITEASKMPVFSPDIGPDGNATAAWLLAPSEPTQTSFSPDAINQSATLEDRSRTWATSRTKWEQAFNPQLVGDGQGSGTGMLGLAAELLGWNKPDPAQVEDNKRLKGPRKAWELRGALPQKLVVGKLESDQKSRDGGLEAFYLNLPQFCDAAV